MSDKQRYARTSTAAHYLDVSKDFLKQHMGNLFLEGVHYYKPRECRILLWKLEALDGWVEGALMPLSPENNLILSQLLA